MISENGFIKKWGEEIRIIRQFTRYDVTNVVLSSIAVMILAVRYISSDIAPVPAISLLIGTFVIVFSTAYSSPLRDYKQCFPLVGLIIILLGLST